MTIKKSTVNKDVYGKDVSTGVEELSLANQINGWDFDIRRIRHLLWVDGVLDDKSHIVLNIHLRNGKDAYESSISFNDGEDRYAHNFSYKFNTERKREADFNKIKHIVDAIFKYYLSRDGQELMYAQSIAKLNEEINENEDRHTLLVAHMNDLLSRRGKVNA